MAVLDKKKTERNLKQKGFTPAKGDHRYLDLIVNGRLVLHTKVSHGSVKDIAGDLIHLMARQCGLTNKQFTDLANCPLSQEAYFAILQQRGYFQ